MGKIKETKNKKYKRFIKEFGSDVFTCDNFNGKMVLNCQACNLAVNPTQRSQMEQHVNTNKHKTNLERWNRSKQMTLTQMDHPKDEFHKELLNWLVVNNIPVSKIDDKSFTEFLVKHINKPISSRFTITRQLDNVFERTMNGIKEQLSDENI